MPACAREISLTLYLQPNWVLHAGGLQAAEALGTAAGWARPLWPRSSLLYTPQQCSAGAGWSGLNASPWLWGRAWHAGKACFVGRIAFRQDTKTLICSLSASLAAHTMLRMSKRGCRTDFCPRPVVYKGTALPPLPTWPATSPAPPPSQVGRGAHSWLSPPSHSGSQRSSLPGPGQLGATDGCPNITLLLGRTAESLLLSLKRCLGLTPWLPVKPPHPRTGSSRATQGICPNPPNTKPNKRKSKWAAPKGAWRGWIARAVMSSLQVGGTLNGRSMSAVRQWRIPN